MKLFSDPCDFRTHSVFGVRIARITIDRDKECVIRTTVLHAHFLIFYPAEIKGELPAEQVRVLCEKLFNAMKIVCNLYLN